MKTTTTRKLIALLAIVALMSVATAATASAHGRARSGRAHMELQFNIGIGDPDSGTVRPDVSWVGTLDFGRARVYGIAFMPTAPLETFGDWDWWHEQVEVYASPGFEFTDGVLTGFDPGPLVFEGPDFGGGTGPFGFAVGRVDRVEPDNDPYDLFTENATGHPFHWRGHVDESMTRFSAMFRVYRTR